MTSLPFDTGYYITRCVFADPARFLMDLKSYDRDNISEKLIEEIEPFISMPEFEPEVVDRASKACSGICMWVRAMHKYYHVVKMVRTACLLCFTLHTGETILSDTIGDCDTGGAEEEEAC